MPYVNIRRRIRPSTLVASMGRWMASVERVNGIGKP